MKNPWIFPLCLIAVVGVQSRAIAHGVVIDYETAQAIAVNAAFDTGEPMADAQVVVYAPDNPSEPWLTGTTNDQGQFLFTPDPSQSGNWEVQVRQAGHGDIVSIPSGELASADAASACPPAPEPERDVSSMSMQGTEDDTLNPLQKVVVAGAVIWGFIGTALFFSRKK